MAKRSKTVVSRRSVQLLKPFTEKDIRNIKSKKSEMIAARFGRNTARLLSNDFKFLLGEDSYGSLHRSLTFKNPSFDLVAEFRTQRVA